MKKTVSFFLNTFSRETLQVIAPKVLKVASLFLRGNTFEDPLIGITYRKLLPYGRKNTRKNALAPDSLSLERHRLLWLYLKQKTNIFTAPTKLLHVAPEYCFRDTFKKMPNIDYLSADYSSPWADVKLDVQEMPFEDNTFDAILCNHVLEHVEDSHKAMKELYRVMKPGGWGIFQVPIDNSREVTYEDKSITDPKEREKHFGQDDHLRWFGKDYGKKLALAGFKVVEDDFVKELGEEKTKRYCILPDEIIYFCTK